MILFTGIFQRFANIFNNYFVTGRLEEPHNQRFTCVTINSSNFGAALSIFRLVKQMVETDVLNIYSESQRMQIIMSARILSSGNPRL